MERGQKTQSKPINNLRPVKGIYLFWRDNQVESQTHRQIAPTSVEEGPNTFLDNCSKDRD